MVVTNGHIKKVIFNQRSYMLFFNLFGIVGGNDKDSLKIILDLYLAPES